MYHRIVPSFFLSVVVTLNAQTINLRGKISNQPGNAVANAVVMLQSQNIKDAFARGRKINLPSGVKGEACGASKLMEADVLNIRESKLSFSKLAAAYGVNKSTIERIKYRKTWRHI